MSKSDELVAEFSAITKQIDDIRDRIYEEEHEFIENAYQRFLLQVKEIINKRETLWRYLDSHLYRDRDIVIPTKNSKLVISYKCTYGRNDVCDIKDQYLKQDILRDICDIDIVKAAEDQLCEMAEASIRKAKAELEAIKQKFDEKDYLKL